MTPPESTTIDLLRHGEPVGGRRFRGSTDDPLSEQGWLQMRTTTAERGGWDRLVSSPLLRCANFAAELAEQRTLPLAVEADLRELHFGDWEGRETAALWKEAKTQMLPFFQNPEANPPPNGERLQDFRKRLMGCWQRLLEQHRGEHLLVICHGGVIRLLLSQVLGLPLRHFSRFDVPYACISQLRVFHTDNGDHPILQSHQPLPAAMTDG